MPAQIRARVLGTVHEELVRKPWDFEGRSGVTRSIVVLDEDANKVPVRFDDSTELDGAKLAKGSTVHLVVDIVNGKANYRGLVEAAGK